ncbi:MAG TPA: hypothetical protein VII12_20365 [Thermoanaerobaculia bacterium]|jgi:hypothetical protein
MKRTFLLMLTMLAGIPSATFAADAYIVRFNAPGRQLGNVAVQWLDDVLFFNTNDNPATVRILGVSNGSLQPDPPQLSLPPSRVVSINAAPVVNVRWLPTPAPSLWVMHVDIPAGVAVESRDELYVSSGIPELTPVARGKVSMPIFKELTPAGKLQIHLGTDLSSPTSRVNVGIYNAGSESATATIEVRRTCDDFVMDSRVVSIAPNTVVQIIGLSVGSSNTCTSRVTPSWMRYTIVTVTQPSLTFVSNLNENLLPAPFEVGVIPAIGLAVTKNSLF